MHRYTLAECYGEDVVAMRLLYCVYVNEEIKHVRRKTLIDKLNNLIMFLAYLYRIRRILDLIFLQVY